MVDQRSVPAYVEMAPSGSGWSAIWFSGRRCSKKGVQCLLAGEVDVGKSILRDYVNPTVRFRELGGLTAKSPKSLRRMLSPNGNPQARNLFDVISCLQECEGLQLKMQVFRWLTTSHGTASRSDVHFDISMRLRRRRIWLASSLGHSDHSSSNTMPTLCRVPRIPLPLRTP